MRTPPSPDCSLVFPPHPVWVRAAREAVRTLLAAARRTELTDTALVLTSEAVTNAVNACQAKGCTNPVTLFAEWTRRNQLHVLVHDDAPDVPALRPLTAPDAESGRGLMLIAHGADAWGVCADGRGGAGKATWFLLGVPAGRAARGRSPRGCSECAELEAARRKAVAGGDGETVVDATVAVRSHFRDAHLLKRGRTW
ncbi:ATP-binding protein [Streptomyces sp. NPDC026206]|uniref:ATP-binding protein n=1 Tax=Streptomyces sp. NPDC026206 TaxID=3157089 RepID=UPI0033CC51BC